jgi:tetratricopeptide (TPR) repeat protein
MARVRQRGTANLDAWLLVTQGLEYFRRFTRQDNARARELAQKALALDPKYAPAHVVLARTHITDYQAGWVSDRAAAFKRAVVLARQALKLNDTYSGVYNLLGAIYLFVNQHDQALIFAEKAVALSPSDSLAKASLAMVQTYAGDPEKAIATMQGAMRLSPYYSDWFLGELGRAYFQAGKLKQSVAASKQRLRRNPKSGQSQLLLAAALAAIGERDAAKSVMAKFLKIRPYYTGKIYAQGEFYKNPADLKRVLDALRLAGLPE